MATWPEGQFQAGQKWIECDRCGFFYTEDRIQVQPENGLNVCTWTPCLDEENPVTDAQVPAGEG